MEQRSISIYQYNINPHDPEVNIARIQVAAGKASQAGSSLLVLPELCLHGYSYENIPSMKRWWLPDITEEISAISRMHSIAIAGTFVEKNQIGFFNTFMMVDSTGKVIHTYRKIHLFGELGEQSFFTAGDSASSSTTAYGTTGAGICYDLRFPELFRKLALDGCLMMILPAEWPASRVNHWRVLLQARAIENQVFMIGVNCTGTIIDVNYAGHSMVISPWGEILAEAGEGEELLSVKLDMEMVDKVRKRIPIWKDRHPETYF